MFDPSDIPRVFGIAPGVDFPKALVRGITQRMEDHPPDAMARVDVIVNTKRMQRRMRELFDQGPALLLPRIRMLSDLDDFLPQGALPQPLAPLRRRLELIQLVSDLIDRQPHLAPRSSLYGLADSLAALLDEMQGEGVDPSAISNLDVTDESGHWANAQVFINIAQDYVLQASDTPDPEARQRKTVALLAQSWAANPPQHPIILAGSTGSRGTTLLLMEEIAKLPQGALVLPGLDNMMPDEVWAAMDQDLTSEDHPQFRFQKLMLRLGIARNDIAPWTNDSPYSPARNALVSLALRPAPVTDAWLDEGPKLNNIGSATADITLVQAETPREEALTIAMRLRKAAEDGQTAALITPDRLLTRQVAAALDRWDIVPDDSAGAPLHLSPPGRFLRHVAGLFSRKLDAEAFLTLLKHPLMHAGQDRGPHQLFTQRLELAMRRHGLPYPDASTLSQLAEKAAGKSDDKDPFLAWISWISETVSGHFTPDAAPLHDCVGRLYQLAETLSAGSTTTKHTLWTQPAGQLARKVMDNLTEQAPFGGPMTASDFGDVLGALLSAEEVRNPDTAHTGIMIWGTLEARVQGADLVILGGLNEGTWPEAPAPDPWLNRTMRHQAGLLLPERRIGLSAHDFQQAVAARHVWMTRSVRSDDAETVPSRWLNRVQNLLGGLPAQGGPDALAAMIKRGDAWRVRAKALEAVTEVPKANRPSPCPPKSARPTGLSVTEIKRLIRDPYAIYAKHSLRLRALNPIVQSPDAPMRGILIHEVMEAFIHDISADASLLTADHLMHVATDVLTQNVPWPAMRALWLAKLSRISEWFVPREKLRQLAGQPVAFEKEAKGILELTDLGFTLIGYADRIDATDAQGAVIYDYKTGNPPTVPQQKAFEKQLLIEAAMLEEGAFKHIGPRVVQDAVYIGLGASPKEVHAPLDTETPAKVLAELHSLIGAYLSDEQGFTSRRMVMSEDDQGDYDQLARFGEWDATDAPTPEDLT